MDLNIGTRQGRKPVRLTIYGFKVKGGRIRLIDKSGNVIATVESGDVGMPSRTALANAEWMLAIERMLERFARQSCKRVADLGSWERKIDVWMDTQHEHVRRRSYTRFFSPTKRRTWDDAIRCLRGQFKNAEHRFKTLKCDGWSQWSETKSRNHRKKGSVRYGDKSGTAGHDRQARLQVCGDCGSATA